MTRTLVPSTPVPQQFYDYCEEQKQQYSPFKSWKNIVGIDVSHWEDGLRLSVHTRFPAGPLKCPKLDVEKHMQAMTTILGGAMICVNGRKSFKTIAGAVKYINSL